MSDWKATVSAIRADRARLHAYFAEETPAIRRRLPSGLIAAALYRVSHYLHRRGLRLASRLVWLLNIVLTGADIDCAARIGPGLVLPHPRMCILYGNAGENCTFIGRNGLGGLFRAAMADIGAGIGRPVLGDSITMEPGALVLGPVRIGSHARIGPQVCVTKDVPPGASVGPRDWISSPART